MSSESPVVATSAASVAPSVHIPAADTISTRLRARELSFKKVAKEADSLQFYTTVVGGASTPKEVTQTSSTLQSIYDHLANICRMTSDLRRFNISTLTDATDYFTGNRMSISECRQNIVAGKNVGLPSVLFHLQSLHNAMQAQAKQALDAVRQHNTRAKTELQRILTAEYNAYVREEQSLRELGSIPSDFKSTYDAKVARMETAFWDKNTATLIDPLNLPILLSRLSKWLDDFEKQREININRANSGAIGTVLEAPASDSPSVSLEELMALVKDQNNAIKTAISRMVVVTWRVANGDPKNLQIANAETSYDNICQLIKAYGIMQSVLRSSTTLTRLNVTNPLNGEPMSAVDVVDFQHIVVPVLSRVLKTAETQKTTSVDYVTKSEPTVRTDVIKLVEGSLGTASSRPSADKMKEYTTGLLESLMPRVVSDTRLEPWITKYSDLLDTFESSVKPMLSTANANTRVKIVWDDVVSEVSEPTWEDLGLDPLHQAELSDSVPMYEALVDVSGWDATVGWNAQPCAPATSRPTRPARPARGRAAPAGAGGRF